MWWREGRGSFIAKMFFISINNVILSNSFAKSESADRHFLVHQTKHRHINIPNTTTIQKSKMVMWYSSKIFLEMDNDKIFCLFSSLFSATDPSCLRWGHFSSLPQRCHVNLTWKTIKYTKLIFPLENISHLCLQSLKKNFFWLSLFLIPSDKL